MPSSPARSVTRQSRLLTAILKSIRLERRMKAAEVAAAMGVALRTYEEFEAGRGRLDLEKVRLFGRATDSDAVAIALALLLGTRETALRAMGNKASTILWIALREFEEEIGDQMAVIPATHFLEAFRQAFDRLRDYLVKRDASTEHWLETEIRRLYSPGHDDPEA